MGASTRDVLGRLRHPIVAAPMAGGASTPALVGEVSAAGGLGFLAAGYRSPADLRADLVQVRARTGALFGVNVFVPATSATDPVALDRYRLALAGEAQRYGVTLGDPPVGDTDGWEEKLALLVEERVPLVSFTFGCPSPSVVDRFHEVGTAVVGTVTSADEARVCSRAGVDVLVVQGPEAGGHRASFTPEPSQGNGVGLLPLLAEVRDAVDLDLIAAGGIMDGGAVAAVLAAGAGAAQLGTAFLRTPESGAHPRHQAALVDPRFSSTSVTLAFSGRPARGLTNRFIREYGNTAPSAYPQVHHLTVPIRKAAAAAGDPDGMALWAGQGHRFTRDLPARRLVEVLAAEAAEAAVLTAGRLRRVPGQPGESR
ncbi:nitronate monooxygenase [Micromonospora sp. SCSIO 07396]